MNGKYDEYKYMRLLVFWRYQTQREEAFILFKRLQELALNKSEYEKVAFLREKHEAIQERLFYECNRAEQIISWLELDSELRQEQLTYPDIFESCMNRLNKE